MVFNDSVYKNGEHYHTQKCKNCGYIDPSQTKCTESGEYSHIVENEVDYHYKGCTFKGCTTVFGEKTQCSSSTGWKQGNFQYGNTANNYKECDECHQHIEEHDCASTDPKAWLGDENERYQVCGKGCGIHFNIHKCIAGDNPEWKHEYVDADNAWKHYHECTICGQHMDENTCDKGDNEWASKTNDDGTVTNWSTCKVCQLEYSSSHTHNYTIEGNTVPPTCTEDGYTIYTCSCGDTEHRNIVSAAHKFDKVESIDNEYHHTICSSCSEEKTNSKTQHTKVDDDSRSKKNATCVEKGENPLKCECGWTGIEDIAIDTNNHNWDINNYTSDATGHWHRCLNEGCIEKKDFSTHSNNDINVNNPTSCSEPGSKDVECSACHYQIATNVPITIEHTASNTYKIVTDTTDNTKAKKQMICSACNNSYGDLSDITENDAVTTFEESTGKPSNGTQFIFGDLSSFDKASADASTYSQNDKDGIHWHLYKYGTDSNAELILLSDNILYKRAFDADSQAWEGSDIKNELNNTQTNKLNVNYDIIKTTTNSDANSQAKIYLLSMKEVGLDYTYENNNISIKEFQKEIFSNDKQRIANFGNLANAWWLRSPSPKYSDSVFCVYNDGDWNGSTYNNGRIGVRPALQLNL